MLLVEKGDGQVRIAKQGASAVEDCILLSSPRAAKTMDKLKQVPGFLDLCYEASICV